MDSEIVPSKNMEFMRRVIAAPDNPRPCRRLQVRGVEMVFGFRDVASIAGGE